MEVQMSLCIYASCVGCQLMYCHYLTMITNYETFFPGLLDEVDAEPSPIPKIYLWSNVN